MACSTYRNLLGARVVLRSSDVEGVRREIASMEGTSALVLTVNGSPLDEMTLAAGGEIVAAPEVDGGAKGKKKKKNYTTPKHVAHKRRKVKLAVLKYYAIEDGKVSNLRANCVGKCPDGVKMASHSDRSHCGRCGITIFKEAQ